MSRDKFRVVVTALITHRGEVLIGRKEDDDSHPIGGQWHILGGHLDYGESLESAVKREVKEETGLEVEVHQLIDSMSFDWNDDGEEDSLRFLYHVEADSKDSEPRDDLEDVKWVEPSKLKDELDTKDSERLEKRENQKKFLEKLQKMPKF